LPALDDACSIGDYVNSRRWKNGFFSGRLGIGADPSDSSRLSVADPLGTPINPSGTAYNFTSYSQSGALQKALAYFRFAIYAGSIDLNSFAITAALYGLFFSPTIKNTGGGAVTVASLVGARIAPGMSTGTTGITITTRTLLELWAGYATGNTIGTQRGINVLNLSGDPNMTNIGIDIQNQTVGAIRILLRAMGLSAANLQVDAGDPPNLGSDLEAQTNLLLSFNENGVVTVRRVQWKQQDQLVAADKVLVAA